MSGTVARIWLVLGPGEPAARAALHKRLVEGRASVSKASKLAPRFKRMFSAARQRVEDDGEADVPALAKTIEEKLVAEAAKVLKATMRPCTAECVQGSPRKGSPVTP